MTFGGVRFYRRRMIALLLGVGAFIALPAMVLGGDLAAYSPAWAYLLAPAGFAVLYLLGIVEPRAAGSIASLAAWGALVAVVICPFQGLAWFMPPLVLAAFAWWTCAQGLRGVLDRERVL